jgi:SAM-dependent methyltransferase/uncharacterized protein YbaR (Trm112 family)
LPLDLPGLRCPATGSPLVPDGDEALVADGGSRRYPVRGGVPILIAEEKSIFSTADFESAIPAHAPVPGRAVLRRLARTVPSDSRNVASRANFEVMGRMLADEARGVTERPLALVIGGGILGHGMEPLLARPEIDFVETDIYIGPRTQLVCDAHDLPFRDNTFDGVVCQAVLEHVLDPPRVVEEIHRVLKPGGIVYSEVPFMQQVHEGAYDFTRFTQLGHRRLFRRFDELRTGAAGGPGMALAWAIRYFAMSFAGRSRMARAAIGHLTTLLTFWLKYFDDALATTPGGLDAASGTFFLGRSRSTEPVGDSEIVAAYAGACPTPDRA